MAQKDNYVANVVNEEKVSQTPSVLVGRPEHKERKTILRGDWDYYTDEQKAEVIGEVFGPLSPNPAHSGFDKQFFVETLPEYPDQEDVNALFIIPQFKDDKVIGYEQWTFDINTNKWRKVYGSDPNLKITKAPAKQAPQGANPPKQAFAQIFNGNVAINGGKLYVNGKEVGQGGGGDSGNHPNVYEVENFENISAEILEQLNVGDIVVESGGGGVVKKLGFVNQITNHLEILHLNGDIFNFYEYHKVGDEWSLDEHYQDVHPRVYAAYLDDIARLTYDELDILDLGDVVRADAETWVVSNFSEEGEDFAIYLCKTTDESIVFVRYVYNEDDDEYTFDTSYGEDGYNVVSLGGGGSDNTIWLNIPFNRDITETIYKPTDVVIHDNTTLTELAKLLPLLTDPERNVKVIWAGEVVSGSVGCEVFSDPDEGTYITLAFAEYAAPGTTITFIIDIVDNAISQVTAKASADDGIEYIGDLTKTYIVNNAADNYFPPEAVKVLPPGSFSQNYHISQPMIYNRNRTVTEPDPVDSDYDIVYWLYSNSFVDLDNDTLVYSEVCIIIKERTDEISYSFNSQGYALTTV